MSWKKLTSRTVFDNPWMRVLEDHVRNPGGGENHYGYVHFKNTAIAVVPIDAEDCTWIVGQDRYTLGEYSWEVPMGGAPLGEDRVAWAHRELREETGLTAGRMTELMKVHTSNSITDEVGYIYIAEDLTEGEASPEETENISVRRLPLTEARDMVMRGEITDAMSCLALLRIQLLRR
jgi:8-oxo-dGTP pyrophosphatase MutT (NUDIX family)